MRNIVVVLLQRCRLGRRLLRRRVCCSLCLLRGRAERLIQLRQRTRCRKPLQHLFRRESWHRRREVLAELHHAFGRVFADGLERVSDVLLKCLERVCLSLGIGIVGVVVGIPRRLQVL